jgi:uncharacterized membrane protein HdeD (DUF308 family)
MALRGILSVLFGLALAIRLGAGASALVWLIGAYAIASGVLLFVLGIWLRGWVQRAESQEFGVGIT